MAIAEAPAKTVIKADELLEELYASCSPYAGTLRMRLDSLVTAGPAAPRSDARPPSTASTTRDR
jgi:hypothetical protein